jgi:Ca-activated chloride channel family protein
MEKRLSVVLAGLVLSTGVGVVADGCNSSDTADAVAGCATAGCATTGCNTTGCVTGCTAACSTGCTGCSATGCSGGCGVCSAACSSSSCSDPPPPNGGPGGGGGSSVSGAGGGGGGVSCSDLDPTMPTVLYLSADDSNSMASPVHARELLHDNRAPSATQIRTYEFLNYYHIAYPSPQVGSLSIFPELQRTSDPTALDMQIALRSWDEPATRRPTTITFVLDTSGSMTGPGITREQAAVKAVAASLRVGDIVSIVTWNTSQAVLLDGHAVTGANDPAIVQVADQLFADGGTDLSAGLVKGYQLAHANYGQDRLNRVILISDGGANAGVTDQDLIAMNSADADQEGIYLAGVGVGPAPGYNDALMDTVTDKGRGAYVYLDGTDEATHVFVDRFAETLDIAARSVQVQLTMPWYFTMKKFYGEAYSTNAAAIEPQHLAPSDAMIFEEIVGACDASQIKGTDTISVHATWTEPVTYTPHTTDLTITVDQMLAAAGAGITKGKAIVGYAEALKTGTSNDLHAALDAVNAANVGGTDPELSEIAGLIPLHPNF